MHILASRAVTIAAVLVGLRCMPAFAGPITVTDVAVNKAQVITLNTPLSVRAYVGQIVLSTTIGAVDVWCIDIYHDISLGSQNLGYAMGTISNDFDGGALTQTQIAEIGGLVIHGDLLLANGGGTSTDSAATQLAIWSIEYSGFTFSGASTATVNEVSALIALAPSLTGSVNAMIALNGTQSFAVESVPEPASVILLGVGVAGLAWARHRRSRINPAVSRKVTISA